MTDISDIQAYNRQSIDRNGFVYMSDKRGSEQLVDKTLKAWDKLESYEKDIVKAREERDAARAALPGAEARVHQARSRLDSLQGQLARATDRGQVAALQSAISQARAELNSAESQLAQARGRLSNAESKLKQLETGRLDFQRKLMDALGLDSSRHETALEINAERDWREFKPTNALEDWAKVYHVGTSKRDDNGNDVEGPPATGKDAIASFMRYGLWNFNQMMKDFSDKILKAISRAASGKGFSLTAND